MSLIVYAIPIFFLLISVELLIGKMKRLSYYRYHDAITNLSCGIGSQVSGLFLKALTVVAYIKLYEISPFREKIPNTWWVWILLFFGVDFFYYWFHRLAHEISIMWGSHVVHHQSEDYNLTVALRQAWYQGAFSFVFYLPLAIAGFRPEMFFVVSQLVTLYQFWIHTRLIGKMHPVIEFFFNTPSHHRVHHGVNPKYIDRNHAGTFIIWDRMFGTFQAEEEEVVYGITKQPKSWNPLWVNFEYWVDLFRDVFRAGSIKNALLMLFKMPGWKPKELGGIAEYKEVTPETFQKYETEISPGLNHYVFVQFILVLLGTTAFLVFQAQEPLSGNWWLKFAAATLIVLSLVSFGGMFERKKWTPQLEIVRLILLVIVSVFLFQGSSVFVTAIAIVAAIAVASLIWFSRFVKEILSSSSSGNLLKTA